ncbi:hypothetical protein [Actinoplanes sp. NPDC026623]|uniref:hypothetical protein n=1 Tax=Actinoplanes sp. NPDC026623 TaxID=3155610 RepID=UPI0033D5AB75
MNSASSGATGSAGGTGRGHVDPTIPGGPFDLTMRTLFVLCLVVIAAGLAYFLVLGALQR